MNKIGIYVHFPFCKSKCKYCNFNSYAGKDDLQLKYFQALLKEIDLYATNDVEIDSIFIGGGTPSIMFTGCISTLIAEIRKKFKVLDDVEITIEANPNSVTKSKVIEWRECGVNRVSVGLQTVNHNLLKLIGRPHTKQDYIQAIEDIKDGGISNINTDCLIGLPRQKMGDVRKTLGLVTKLGCSHISVYSLILEENTPLFDLVNEGLVRLPKEEKTIGMYDYTLKFLREKGYQRYEVSNFAQNNMMCKHNLNTWQMHEYLGFGSGAHGYYKGHRYCNVEQIEDYIKMLGLSQKPISEDEKISKKEKLEETIMLGLRTSLGVNVQHLKDNFNFDILNKKANEINNLLKNGLILIKGNNLIVTDKGMHILNKIILDLVY